MFYYKEHIPLIKHDDICSLGNCLVMEIHSENEPVFIVLQAIIMMNFKISAQTLIHFLTT